MMFWAESCGRPQPVKTSAMDITVVETPAPKALPTIRQGSRYPKARRRGADMNRADETARGSGDLIVADGP